MFEPLPLPPLEHVVLANGLQAIAIENPAAAIMVAQVFVRAGSLQEPPGQAGAGHALAATLTKGTDRLSSRAIAEQVESLGAILSTDAAADYFVLSLKTAVEDFPAVLALAAAVLQWPGFPAAEVELERRLTLQAIRSQLEQPFALAFEQLRRALYGLHPYAVSTLGREETAANLGPEELRAFHGRYFRPDNAVIALCGCLPTSAALALVQHTFGNWQAPVLALPGLDLPRLNPPPGNHILAQPSQQAIALVGYPAAAVRGPSGGFHPDYAALKLAATYLGNGSASRLFVELREKRGLAYEVSAMYPTRWSDSFFCAYLGTAPSNLAIALAALRSEVDRLAQETIAADELASAQQKLLGQYALGKQTNGQLAHLLGWYEALGLGVEFDHLFQRAVLAVSPAELQAVAQRYFTEPVISLVGPEEAVAPFRSSPGA